MSNGLFLPGTKDGIIIKETRRTAKKIEKVFGK